jgi:hypothetical protein
MEKHSRFKISVVDPDPDLKYVFGPIGSDSDPLARVTDLDPDPSIIKQKL